MYCEPDWLDPNGGGGPIRNCQSGGVWNPYYDDQRGHVTERSTAILGTLERLKRHDSTVDEARPGRQSDKTEMFERMAGCDN